MQIASDIHLDMLGSKWDRFKITPHAKCLALLGDIGNPNKPNYWKFIEEQSKQFKHVFLVPGNHEYYSGEPMEDIVATMRTKCKDFENVHLLDNDVFLLYENGNKEQSVKVIGSTLWSLISSQNIYRLNDFRYIYDMDIHRYHRLHRNAVKYITDMLESEPQIPAIVLTHHGNILEMSGKFKGDSLNDAFVSDLSYLLDPNKHKIIAWASGHVHSNVDTMKNGVRCVSNARGYRDEIFKSRYRDNVVIELPYGENLN